MTPVSLELAGVFFVPRQSSRRVRSRVNFSAVSCVSMAWSPRRSASVSRERSSRWRRSMLRRWRVWRASSTCSKRGLVSELVEVCRASARRVRLVSSGAASSGLSGAGACARTSMRAAEAVPLYHSGCSASWVAARVRAESDSGRTRVQRRMRSTSLRGSRVWALTYSRRWAAAR